MFEDEKSMKKKIMRMVTDSTPVEAPKNTETCSLFALYKLVADTQGIEAMREKYNKGGTGYGEVKKELAELMLEYFRPFREKRSMFEKDRGEVVNILKKGAEKTREIAKQNLKKIRNAVGLNYRQD
jgi:tryptophanyl-tRNA synthetase